MGNKLSIGSSFKLRVVRPSQLKVGDLWADVIAPYASEALKAARELSIGEDQLTPRIILDLVGAVIVAWNAFPKTPIEEDDLPSFVDSLSIMSIDKLKELLPALLRVTDKADGMTITLYNGVEVLSRRVCGYVDAKNGTVDDDEYWDISNYQTLSSVEKQGAVPPRISVKYNLRASCDPNHMAEEWEKLKAALVEDEQVSPYAVYLAICFYEAWESSFTYVTSDNFPDYVDNVFKNGDITVGKQVLHQLRGALVKYLLPSSQNDAGISLEIMARCTEEYLERLDRLMTKKSKGVAALDKDGKVPEEKHCEGRWDISKYACISDAESLEAATPIGIGIDPMSDDVKTAYGTFREKLREDGRVTGGMFRLVHSVFCAWEGFKENILCDSFPRFVCKLFKECEASYIDKEALQDLCTFLRKERWEEQHGAADSRLIAGLEILSRCTKTYLESLDRMLKSKTQEVQVAPGETETLKEDSDDVWDIREYDLLERWKAVPDNIDVPYEGEQDDKEYGNLHVRISDMFEKVKISLKALCLFSNVFRTWRHFPTIVNSGNFPAFVDALFRGSEGAVISRKAVKDLCHVLWGLQSEYGTSNGTLNGMEVLVRSTRSYLCTLWYMREKQQQDTSGQEHKKLQHEQPFVKIKSVEYELSAADKETVVATFMDNWLDASQANFDLSLRPAAVFEAVVEVYESMGGSLFLGALGQIDSKVEKLLSDPRLRRSKHQPSEVYSKRQAFNMALGYINEVWSGVPDCEAFICQEDIEEAGDEFTSQQAYDHIDGIIRWLNDVWVFNWPKVEKATITPEAEAVLQDKLELEQEQGETTMTTSKLNSHLEAIVDGTCKLDMLGRTAIRTTSGYKAYDAESKQLVKCDGFLLDIGNDSFVITAATELQPGYVLIVGDATKCVVSIEADHVRVVDYESGMFEQLAMECDPILGSVKLYTRIINPVGDEIQKRGKAFSKKLFERKTSGKALDTRSEISRLFAGYFFGEDIEEAEDEEKKPAKTSKKAAK